MSSKIPDGVDDRAFVYGYAAAMKAVAPLMTPELAEALRKDHPLFGDLRPQLSTDDIAFFQQLIRKLGLDEPEAQEGES